MPEKTPASSLYPTKGATTPDKADLEINPVPEPDQRGTKRKRESEEELSTNSSSDEIMSKIITSRKLSHEIEDVVASKIKKVEELWKEIEADTQKLMTMKRWEVDTLSYQVSKGMIKLETIRNANTHAGRALRGAKKIYKA